MSKPSQAGAGGLWYPGLDGVRGIAVGLVFMVHYLRSWGHIGWMGVLIFFVLSGFLITGVLFDGRDETHRYRNFYIRRALRIFPLFYFVWIVVLLGAFFLREQWHPLLALWPVYLGNFVRFIAGSRAADQINTRFPTFPIEIGHFWSLAVEEQFYLVWPFVVFKVTNRRTLIAICSVLTVVVVLLRLSLLHVLPASFLELEFFYRMTFTQADAFLIGALLALLLRGPMRGAILRLAPSFFVAMFAIFASVCWLNGPGHNLANLNTSSRWMSGYGFTLLDLAAAGLIMCGLRSGSLVSYVLNFAPLRFLGRYSYGFYVFHVLLLPMGPLYLINVATPPVMLLHFITEFLIVLAVSVVSYHLLEQPFLRLKNRWTRRDLISTSGAISQ